MRDSRRVLCISIYLPLQTYTITSDDDVIIDLDKQCNYDAPLILDSSYPHPPFRLPAPTGTENYTVL